MKKIVMTMIIAIGALTLSTTVINAKCGGDKVETSKPADTNGTKGKCGAGKCGSGKCGGK
ncbi:hypothetical protein MNB_SV-9-273 [hydrothermal vent metagenome]|uniref:Uncharacterized protein n=1 Tax=hydrothermal vent metagenome TaxID=652676 RepID=A0A1W1CEM5_9ZZZZ